MLSVRFSVPKVPRVVPGVVWNTGARWGSFRHHHGDKEDAVLSGVWDKGSGSSLQSYKHGDLGKPQGRGLPLRAR